MARASRWSAVARLTMLVSGVPALRSMPWNQSRERSRSVSGADVVVVLEVVADDERGAVLAAATAAEALAGAEGFDDDAVAEDDRVVSPDGAVAGGVGIGFGEEFVFEEFGLEVFEVGAGLVFGVGDDPDVGLAMFEGRLEDDRRG